MNTGVKKVNIFAGRLHGLGEAVGNLLVDGFHLLALFAIGGTIVWAAVLSFMGMVEGGGASIEDILLLFIYLELGAMVGIYFKTNHMPVRFLIYVAMTALTRLLIGSVNVEHVVDIRINLDPGTAALHAGPIYPVVANALRRALRTGEGEAVPRLSDLEARETSTAGKLELEYAGADRSETEVVRDLMRRAARVVFDAQVPLEGVASVVESFNQGWKVEVSSDMASADYLVGLDEIPGLREAAARLAGGDSPPRLASAIEFVLEGLHLSNRLNKTTTEGKAQYARA